MEINNHSWSEDEKLNEKPVAQKTNFLYALPREKKDEVIFMKLLSLELGAAVERRYVNKTNSCQ